MKSVIKLFASGYLLLVLGALLQNFGLDNNNVTMLIAVSAASCILLGVIKANTL
jgi:hypothetical protein